MAVLLPIKPKYVLKNKKYEFRKSILKKKDISTDFIYSTLLKEWLVNLPP